MAELSESRFNMWRALVALIHADGHRNAEEDQFFQDYFEKMAISDSQKSTLIEDIKAQHNVWEFFEKISEPRDRSQLIYLSRILFYCDGDFHEQEKTIHQKLTDKVMSHVNLEAAMKEVDQVTAEFWEQQKQKSSQRSWREKFTDALVFWEDI